MPESPLPHQLLDLWPKIRHVWEGLDRFTRFTLLDLVMYLLTIGNGLVNVESLAIWLNRERHLTHRAVDHLVGLGLLFEKGAIQDQRYVALNTGHETMPFFQKLAEVLGATRQARVTFMRLLAGEEPNLGAV